MSYAMCILLFSNSLKNWQLIHSVEVMCSLTLELGIKFLEHFYRIRFWITQVKVVALILCYINEKRRQTH